MAQWFEHRNDDRGILGLNPVGGTLLRNFGNSVNPILPVSFGCDTKSRRSVLPGVYARGSKKSHTRGKCVTCRGLHNSEIKHSCISARMVCLE